MSRRTTEMKLLINVPLFHSHGGVSIYYRSLAAHFSPAVHYQHVGSRVTGQSILNTLLHTVSDHFRFIRRLLSEKFTTVLLNPSLDPKSLVRDGLYLLLAKGLGRTVIVFFRGWSPMTAAAIEARYLRPFRSVFGRADGIITLSKDFDTAIRRWEFRGPTFVETTAVDDQLLQGLDIPAIRRATRDADRPFRLLFMSRLEKAKGVYRCLDAMRMLSQKLRGLELHFAGNGSELEPLKVYVERERIPDVIFHGHVSGESKRSLLLQSDLFLFPSDHEGMPNAVLEAMGFGLPVVTRSVGGLVDFFEQGKMGFITDSTDASTLAEYIEQLYNDPTLREEIALRNHHYAADHFLASNVAKRVEGICRSVTEGRAAGGSSSV